LREVAGCGKARLNPNRRQMTLESDPGDLLARAPSLGTRQGKHTADSLMSGNP
jgi:hypothetical protein